MTGSGGRSSNRQTITTGCRAFAGHDRLVAKAVLRGCLVVELQVCRLDYGGNAVDVLVDHGAEIGAGIAAWRDRKRFQLGADVRIVDRLAKSGLDLGDDRG